MFTRDAKLWLALLAGGLSGIGSTYGGAWLVPGLFRPDPYTATTAYSVKLVLDYRLDAIEDRLNDLESDTENLPPEEWRRRIMTLEREVQAIMIRMDLQGP